MSQAVHLVSQVIQLGGSASDLSLVAFGSALGLTLSVLIGGVVADRVPQRRILLVVEAVRGLGFAAAAVLALTHLASSEPALPRSLKA